MKIALVYDRVNKWGGAERVLLSLHEIWPQAPLYTAVYNPKTASWAKVFKVIPSFLQRFFFARSHHEMLAPLMPIAFESFNFDEYEVVVSITSEAAKGIITKPKTCTFAIVLPQLVIFGVDMKIIFPQFQKGWPAGSQLLI